MTPEKAASTLTVMEAGFKIIPGKETDFLSMQAKMVPVGASQPGFVSVYGGPILDSSWLYFGVRFESAAQMDAWFHTQQHQAVQKMAYAKWWTAVYIRKWRSPAPGETLGSRLMCETRLTTAAALDDERRQSLQPFFKELSAAGARPFETLTGNFENQPWQFVGPLEIFPALSGPTYSLITHWSSAADLAVWQRSPAYGELKTLGQVSSEVFIAMEEPGVRDHLREDRLQRQWTLEGHAAA